MTHLRGFTAIASMLALAAGTAPITSQAQSPTPYDNINSSAAASPITTQKLRGNISVLEGSGGNIGVFAGTDGILMVDTGIAVSQQKILAALRTLSPQPLRYVVDTHWHWDHTDGNAWVRARGTTIISSRKGLERLTQTNRVVEWSHTFTPIAPKSLPNLIIDGAMTFEWGGETIQIRPYEVGHTDGDLSVYFQKADILQTGDTWWNGYYPFIDTVTGGSIDHAIAAAEVNLGLAGESTIIIPGHGPVGNRKELQDFRDMLVAVKTRVAALKWEGKTLEEIVAAHPTAEFDARWDTGLINGDLFTTLVYRGV